MQADTLEQSLVIPPEVRRGVRRRRWTAVVVVALLAAAGTAYGVVRNRPVPPQYRTTLVERRTVVREVEATGHVDVTTRVDVNVPEDGHLIELFVKAGDTVTANQPLARLDQRAAVIGLQSAQANVAAAGSRVLEAETALTAATEARARTERLLAKELASAADLEAARSTESKARAALATARADRSATSQGLKSAELTRSLTTIVSPIDGVMLEAPTSLGPAVAPDKKALFVVGSALETLRVDADVAEAEVGRLHPGQTAHFSVPAYPGRNFDGKVERIGIDAERTSSAVRYPVELSADNHERALLPGMTATVTIEVARAENAVAVREAALRFRPEGATEAEPRHQVWTLTGKGLEAIAVQPGLSDGAFTVVEPEPPALLPVGTRLVLGVVASDSQKSSGPGIKLGK
ncbi:MAG TPA: efflux RND transporter periplasmic adaptor subunit [Polyangiaceae bacterium]|nr:efflux RND transporter periplasmic adaptor subunit [Polyangiaceae bacterium]